MTLRWKSSYEDIVKLLLDKMPWINHPQFNFITEIFGLFLRQTPHFIHRPRKRTPCKTSLYVN